MSIDFADDAPSSGDPVADALAKNFRGLPLDYSRAAQLAASRYGLVMMGLAEDDFAANRTYPGMTDDVGIVTFCALCSADAGALDECPKEMRGLLRRKTLRRTRGQLAEALLDFFDAFDLDPMDEEIYNVGFELMNTAWESRPIVTADEGDMQPPGKRQQELATSAT